MLRCRIGSSAFRTPVAISGYDMHAAYCSQPRPTNRRGLTMTEITRRLLLAGAAAVPFAGWARLADAATPKDTAVFAKQIDDIISLDPAESYELSGSEVSPNIYDRIHALRAGGPDQAGRRRRQSWTVSDGRQDLHLQDPPGPEIPSGGRSRPRMRRFRCSGSCCRQDAGLPVHPARLVEGQCRQDLVKAQRRHADRHDQPGISRRSLVLKLMSSIVGSVVEKKVAMEHETNGDLGNGWLKTHSAASGAFKLRRWKANESVASKPIPASAGRPEAEARGRPPCAGAGRAAPAAREGRRRLSPAT